MGMERGKKDASECKDPYLKKTPGGGRGGGRDKKTVEKDRRKKGRLAAGLICVSAVMQWCDTESGGDKGSCADGKGEKKKGKQKLLSNLSVEMLGKEGDGRCLRGGSTVRN